MKLVEDQRRPYRMVARAEAFEATGRRILEAAGSRFGATVYEQVSLDAIAAESQTTVQTIIRRFGSKENLLAEVIRCRRAAVHGQRGQAQVGDVEGALAILYEEYERWGDEILLFLSQEGRNDLISDAVQSGRAFHHRWVKEIFGPLLVSATPARRRRARQQVTAATDLYVWKILRRDLGLDPRAALAAVTGMVQALLSPFSG